MTTKTLLSPEEEALISELKASLPSKPFFNLVSIDSLLVDHQKKPPILEYVKELAESQDEKDTPLWDPVFVTEEPDGALRLVDGKHRHAALRQLGINGIVCFRLPLSFKELLPFLGQWETWRRNGLSNPVEFRRRLQRRLLEDED